MKTRTISDQVERKKTILQLIPSLHHDRYLILLMKIKSAKTTQT